MPGKFVIKKGSTGKYRFNLLSTNGQVIASSESYNSKASCMSGVKAVQRLAAEAEVEDRTTRDFAKAQEAAKVAKAAKKSARRPAKRATKRS
jgi:hypothetical protein